MPWTLHKKNYGNKEYIAGKLVTQKEFMMNDVYSLTQKRSPTNTYTKLGDTRAHFFPFLVVLKMKKKKAMLKKQGIVWALLYLYLSYKNADCAIKV